MKLHLSSYLLPESQRRSPDELSADLDLATGDSSAKRSAYWAMLVFSAVIASAGLLSDSTATVIGAMIIAPLSTPIMGIALGIAKRAPSSIRDGARYVFFGALVVVLVGMLFSLILPGSYDLLGNNEIASRTSPGLMSLVAAVATGFAGSLGFARRDVAAVLPGVAIAISLVPPLAVSGICLGERSYALAGGAMVLFLSNLLALILAGTLVFAGLVIKSMAGSPKESRRKALLTVSLLLVIVTVPLATNTVANYLLTIWEHRVEVAADAWVSEVPGASVQDVGFASHKILVRIQTPAKIPPVDDLMDKLEGQVPNGVPVVITTELGQDIDAGVVGGS